ncbi:hypothetical protein ACE6H2_027914 [Prunus campanulata]
MLEETNLCVISHIDHFIRRFKRVYFSIFLKSYTTERIRSFQEICPTHWPVTRLHQYLEKPNAHGSKL